VVVAALVALNLDELAAVVAELVAIDLDALWSPIAAPDLWSRSWWRSTSMRSPRC
jgi:hypothetical protein